MLACIKPIGKSITIAKNFCDQHHIDLSHIPNRHLKKSRSLSTNYNYGIDRDNITIALWLTRPHQSGCMYIQESAASIPASLICAHDNITILDMCASPGGKTAQLVDKCRPYSNTLIVANEPNFNRLSTLKENLLRMHANNIAYTQLDWSKFGSVMNEIFDIVLLDAPCSWEWTAFKSHDALSHRRIEEIKKIANLQYQLLTSALQTCKPWGIIVYSTCTINPLENESNIQKLLQEYKGVVALLPINIPEASKGIQSNEYYDISSEISLNTIRCRPHIHRTWWFFVAMIQKISWLKTTPPPWLSYKKSEKISKLQQCGQKTILLIHNYLFVQFGIEQKEWYYYYEDSTYIYVCTRMVTWPIEYQSKSRWIPILKKINHDIYTPLSHIASVYGKYAKKNILILNDQQIELYLNGVSIDIQWYDNGRYIIQYNHLSMTVGKLIWSTLKYKQ